MLGARTTVTPFQHQLEAQHPKIFQLSTSRRPITPSYIPITDSKQTWTDVSSVPISDSCDAAKNALPPSLCIGQGHECLHHGLHRVRSRLIGQRTGPRKRDEFGMRRRLRVRVRADARRHSDRLSLLQTALAVIGRWQNGEALHLAAHRHVRFAIDRRGIDTTGHDVFKRRRSSGVSDPEGVRRSFLVHRTINVACNPLYFDR
jgi:hypothetical protein